MRKVASTGPFTETKELIASYWIWQVRSIEQAVEWAAAAPIRPRRGRRAGDSPDL